MQSVTAADLLQAWEAGLTQHPVQRGLTLLALVWPLRTANDLADLSIGQRDADLLSLREQIFGALFHSVARCPRCDDRLDLTFQADEIRAPLPVQVEQTMQRQIGEYSVQFRLPTSHDLLALAGMLDAATARQHLLQRCLLTVSRSGTDITESVHQAAPAALVDQVLAQMAELAPQGDVQLALICPNCRHRWTMAFDILAYLWSEINDWAQRTLRDVHLLATAYGWREADILAVSAQRRHFYLSMIEK